MLMCKTHNLQFCTGNKLHYDIEYHNQIKWDTVIGSNFLIHVTDQPYCGCLSTPRTSRGARGRPQSTPSTDLCSPKSFPSICVYVYDSLHNVCICNRMCVSQQYVYAVHKDVCLSVCACMSVLDYSRSCAHLGVTDSGQSVHEDVEVDHGPPISSGDRVQWTTQLGSG